MRRCRTFAVALSCGLVLACGGPLGPLPGGRLTGPEAARPVDDWSFTRDVRLVQLETRPADPWSVTLGCIDHEGALYVGSHDPTDRWVRNALADPRVRLRVDHTIHPRNAVEVTDRTEWMIVGRKLFEKYDIEYDPDREPGILFRLEPRTAP